MCMCLNNWFFWFDFFLLKIKKFINVFFKRVFVLNFGLSVKFVFFVKKIVLVNVFLIIFF